MNVEIGTEAAQFLFWEHINRNFFAVCVILKMVRFWPRLGWLASSWSPGFASISWWGTRAGSLAYRRRIVALVTSRRPRPSPPAGRRRWDDRSTAPTPCWKNFWRKDPSQNLNRLPFNYLILLKEEASRESNCREILSYILISFLHLSRNFAIIMARFSLCGWLVAYAFIYVVKYTKCRKEYVVLDCLELHFYYLLR